MAETVFILGAGASMQAGVPLMKGFLNKTRDVVDSSDDVGLKADLTLVTKARTKLEAAVARVSSNLGNLEELLGLFEMGDIVGSMLGMTDEERPKLVPALTRLITATIEGSLVYHHSGDGITPAPHSTHAGFARLVRSLTEKESPSSVAIITLNWDCAIELALHQDSVRYTYCLPSDSSALGVKVLKLHGSINWQECRVQGKGGAEIHVVRVEDYVSRPRRSGGQFASETEVLPLSREAGRLPGAGSQGPLIVAPSWTKTAAQKLLEPVWKEAAGELSSASRIYIIGYSLPPTDRFFRDLLSLGLQGGTPVERFWVFDPDGSKGDSSKETAQDRYDRIPGQTIKENAYQFWPLTFSKALRQLQEDAAASG
jgi:hypothetical protein